MKQAIIFAVHHVYGERVKIYIPWMLSPSIWCPISFSQKHQSQHLGFYLESLWCKCSSHLGDVQTTSCYLQQPNLVQVNEERFQLPTRNSAIDREPGGYYVLGFFLPVIELDETSILCILRFYSSIHCRIEVKTAQFINSGSNKALQRISGPFDPFLHTGVFVDLQLMHSGLHLAAGENSYSSLALDSDHTFCQS